MDHQINHMIIQAGFKDASKMHLDWFKELRYIQTIVALIQEELKVKSVYTLNLKYVVQTSKGKDFLEKSFISKGYKIEYRNEQVLFITK